MDFSDLLFAIFANARIGADAFFHILPHDVGRYVITAGGVFVILLEQGSGVPLGIAGALATGLGLGALNGVLIAVAGLSPLLTTLGIMLIVRGLGLTVIGGRQHALPEGAQGLREAAILGVGDQLHTLVDRFE